MTAYPFMRFYFGDYMAKARHLTTTQHGAYFLILMAMWANHGYLPDDDNELAAVTGLRLDRWKRMRPRLARLLTFTEGRVTQSRLLEEWHRAEQTRVNCVLSGASGGRAKALKYNVRDVAIAKRSGGYPEPYRKKEGDEKKEQRSDAQKLLEALDKRENPLKH